VPSRRWGQQRSEWGQSTRTREWGIPPAVQLKPGAYVMCLANASKLKYANGDCGHVVEVTPAGVEVELVRTGNVELVKPVVRDVAQYDKPSGFLVKAMFDEEASIGYHPEPHKRGDKFITGQIQYMPLRCAWSTTIHKSQSLSLDAVQCDFRDSFLVIAVFSMSRYRVVAH